MLEEMPPKRAKSRAPTAVVDEVLPGNKRCYHKPPNAKLGLYTIILKIMFKNSSLCVTSSQKSKKQGYYGLGLLCLGTSTN